MTGAQIIAQTVERFLENELIFASKYGIVPPSPKEIVAAFNIDVFVTAFQVLDIRRHQFGFTGSTDARDNLDVGSAGQLNDSIEIFCSHNCFHIVVRFQKLKNFHFSKPY